MCNGVSHGVTLPLVTVPPTRPDPTRPISVVPAVCGVSNKACIRRQGRERTTPATMHVALRAEMGAV